MALPTDRGTPGGSRPFIRLRSGLNDALWLVLVVLLFPLMILLIGAPIALVLRGLIEIARRL